METPYDSENYTIKDYFAKHPETQKAPAKAEAFLYHIIYMATFSFCPIFEESTRPYLQD